MERRRERIRVHLYSVWLRLLLTGALVGMTLGLACTSAELRPTTLSPAPSLRLTSSAFAPGGPIPTDDTSDGADRSPPLSWSDPPAGTVAFVLVVEDPDAPSGLFTHWLLYDLPAGTRSLPPGLPTAESLANGARQGRNDFGTLGYRGPCPPPGPPHRYAFRLYALDRLTGLPPGAQRAAVLRAVEGHVLATGELVGTYRRESAR